MSGKPVMLVTGDSQAEALALALRGMPAVSSQYDVSFAADVSSATVSLKSGDIVFYQGTPASPFSKNKRVRKITLPKLRFGLLWPLAAPAPPSSTFSTGDAFITACAQQGVQPAEIRALYNRPTWSASWPNLDALFRDVTGELVKWDAENDVTIGSYILKNFRKWRLFWSPAAPANALLAELTYRMLHVAFGRGDLADRSEVSRVFESLGAQQLMERAAVPVHPLVAAHFALEWYNAGEAHLGLDGVRRTFDEYYTQLINDSA